MKDIRQKNLNLENGAYFRSAVELNVLHELNDFHKKDSIDHMKHMESSSKKKNNDEATESRSTRDNTSPSKMESLQSRLVHAQEEIRDERRRADQIAEKLRQWFFNYW